jgi:dipeptidyl aminopeptidase/acylaminoacyl peptidase
LVDIFSFKKWIYSQKLIRLTSQKMLMMVRIYIFLVFLFSVSSGYAQSQRLTPETLWELGRVSLDDVSPDGKWALYGVSYYDISSNTGSRDLYLIPLAGGESIQLTNTPQSESNGQFRPDGEWIGFLRDGKIFEISLSDKVERQVGYADYNGFLYSPTGDHILFTMDVQYDKAPNQIHRDIPKTSGRVIDDLMYRHWNSWHDYKYSNIFTIPYENGKLVGEPINIIKEAYDSPLQPFGGMEEIAWSPDGSQIAYTCKKQRGKEYAQSTNSDIYLYELAGRTTRNLSASNPGYDKEPAFSPDGRYLVWNQMTTPGFEADRNRIILFDLEKDKTTEVSAGWDRDANHPKWSADGKTLYFTSGEQATYQLFSVPVKGKNTPRQITSGQHNYYSFHPAGAYVLASRASMSMPHELYRVDLSNGEAVALTKVNASILGGIKMGKVEKRMVKTTDGKDMLTWVIYPPDFDPSKKYPALLYCQGGPQSAVSQFWSYRWNFQMMAANDYIIVAPNRRGLPSFGREWNDQISGDWGGQAMKDLLSAIDQLGKETFIDEDRLGAVGASFGGYSVYWLAGNHNKRFKAFISHCGIFNMESWYGTTEELFFANQDLEGPYWQEPLPETYRLDSPHTYVDNWDTPILVIHCEKDFRVPIGEGMQAFQAAQLKGIPSQFLYFPDEGHWVTKPQNSVLWQRTFFGWLDKYLK